MDSQPVVFKGRIAFAAVPQGDQYGLGVAEENEPGYRPYRGVTGLTYEEAHKLADEMNGRLGLSGKDAILIVASTMRSRFHQRWVRRP